MGGCSHAEVSVEKVKLAAEEVGGPVMCEDTSLCFNALNGSRNPTSFCRLAATSL